MMKIKDFNILIAAILISSFSISAQKNKIRKDSTSLKRELTLERQYNPEIKDASKINVLPELRDPVAHTGTVQYADYSIPYDIKPQVSVLQPKSYFSSLDYSKKKGYFNISGSSFPGWNSDAGYKILNTEKDLLNVYASYKHIGGDVRYLQDKSKSRMRINDFFTGTDFRHKFDTFTMNAGLSYTNSAYNYFGYPFSTEEIYRSGPLQHTDLLGLDLGVSSNEGNDLFYKLGLDYSHFKNKYLSDLSSSGNSENQFNFNWDLNTELNTDFRFGVMGYINNYLYSEDGGYYKGEREEYGLKNFSMISGVPYFYIEGGNWDARLGVRINYSFGLSYNEVSPYVVFNVHPFDKSVFYINVDGGVYDNSLKNMYTENRYMNPDYRIANSKSPFNGTLGFRSSLGQLAFDIFGGYARLKKEHFFIPLAGNGMSVEYSDASLYRFGLDLKYILQQNIDFGFKTEYDYWSLNNKTMEAWNRPRFQGDLSLGYKVQNFPLRIDGVYHLETGRRGKNIIDGNPVSMKNVNELNVRVSIPLNESFSVFAGANNLLNQKYDLWYGYPARNFSVMGGFGIKF